ncbi:MAG TPA: efflux RND transporter permease subunit [Gemmatimonadaceae bacterium]|nr:efflux RND transporter permease subunit [Gemmatimonadaceae bacterium]
MWIVQLGLKRPYTFIVMAMLILIFGVVTLGKMATDIFPSIDIPVVTVIWTYAGLSPEDMERTIITPHERGMTTTVDNIEHMESESLTGYAIEKVFFHPGTDIAGAIAQVSAISETILRIAPQGTTPPFIVRFNASNVPVLQAALSSTTLSEQDIYDLGYNFMRTQLATVQGAQVPLPYGGKVRQIMVDLDPRAMYANGISPNDVSNAVNAQSLILPAGTAKFGTREYQVHLNSAPDIVQALNDLPVKQVNGATVFLRDVGQVRDGYAVQQSIVRQNGQRGALLTILKAGNASTLDVVSRVRARLPQIMATLPPTLHAELLGDQSVFVRAAVAGVIREGVIAGCLTAIMILLFLGSWRSTLIVALSIPLAILTSVIVLGALHETINSMTLGGFALAVGILVDDATVGIENIHRHADQGKDVENAILVGASEIAVPTFVSTLCICIVFVPILALPGVAGFLFAPLALAVIFAMLASYLLSRTLVPTLVKYALIAERGHGQHFEGEAEGQPAAAKHSPAGTGWFGKLFGRFEAMFEALRRRYDAALLAAVTHRRLTSGLFIGGVLASFLLVPFIGRDFFPSVDGGQIRLHVRAPPGTRIEETEQIVAGVERQIRQVIPPGDLKVVLDNIGIGGQGLDLAFSDNPTIGSTDGELLITLSDERKGKTADYVDKLRGTLSHNFPGVSFFFQPADIVGQILNFGLPAPIDVQVVGRNRPVNYPIAMDLVRKIGAIPGAADVHLAQVVNAPDLLLSVDRSKAQQIGLSQRDVANDMIVTLSSNVQVSPNYWINPQNGVNYPLVVQTPQSRVTDMGELGRTPVHAAGSLAEPQLLANLTNVTRRNVYSVVTHYNVQPVFDIYANVSGSDLGGVSDAVDKVVANVQKTLPRGTTIAIRGQVQSMRAAFTGLGFGLAFAIVLVYLLMVVNFQSWLDPLIIVMALPGALAGIVWALFLTQTTFSVPSLMGAIMAMGVATANSVLMVTFANDQRPLGRTAVEAALEAGHERLRPVMMTALAMIIGMLPMALGLGEGGEQNAPLGRAVIGGLLVATFATLFFVPVVYTMLRTRGPKGSTEGSAT